MRARVHQQSRCKLCSLNSLSTSAPLKTPSHFSPLKFSHPISSQISLLSNSLTPYPLKFLSSQIPFPHILSNLSPLKFPLPLSSQIFSPLKFFPPYPLKFSVLSNILSNSQNNASQIILKNNCFACPQCVPAIEVIRLAARLLKGMSGRLSRKP